jgi:biopolymer transport protein TolR
MAGALLELPDPEREDTGVYRPVAEMNVTPMVDVMLVLLIIFMVAAPLMTVGVPIALPKTAAAKVAEPKQPVVVSIDKDGQVFLDKEQLAPDTIAARLKQAASVDAERVVLVRGDRSIEYGRVMELMGNVNAAGFSKVSLIGEPAPAQAKGSAGTPINP